MEKLIEEKLDALGQMQAIEFAFEMQRLGLMQADGSIICDMIAVKEAIKRDIERTDNEK